MQKKLSIVLEHVADTSDIRIPIAYCSQLLDHHPRSSWQELREAAVAILLERISFPKEPTVQLTASSLACFAQKVAFIMPDEDNDNEEDDENDQDQEEEDDSFIDDEQVETKKRCR
jgi:predicted small lipoprotein YifL